jgi:hypothetical protein
VILRQPPKYPEGGFCDKDDKEKCDFFVTYPFEHCHAVFKSSFGGLKGRILEAKGKKIIFMNYSG